MSWLQLDPNEQNTGQVNAVSGTTAPGQPIPGTGAQGAFVGGGTGGVGGKSGLAPAVSAPVTTGNPTGGGGYTNLSAYLGANQGGQSTAAANNVVNGAGAAETAATNNWSTVNDTAAHNNGVAVSNADIADNAATLAPTSSLKAAPTVSYTTPTPATTVTADPGVQGAASNLAGYANNASGNAGFGGYTALANSFGGGGLSAASLNEGNVGANATNATNAANSANNAATVNLNTINAESTAAAQKDNNALLAQWNAQQAAIAKQAAAAAATQGSIGTTPSKPSAATPGTVPLLLPSGGTGVAPIVIGPPTDPNAPTLAPGTNPGNPGLNVAVTGTGGGGGGSSAPIPLPAPPTTIKTPSSPTLASDYNSLASEGGISGFSAGGEVKKYARLHKMLKGSKK